MATTDTELIAETIEEVNQFRDLGLWNRLEDHFVHTPYIDDQSLTKELPGSRPVKEVINGWRKELMSYFYATKHTISNLRIKQKGKREVEATTPTTIKYFIADSGNRYVLTVIGTYTYNLVKRAGRWKIGKLTFNLHNQQLRQIGLPAGS